MHERVIARIRYLADVVGGAQTDANAVKHAYAANPLIHLAASRARAVPARQLGPQRRRAEGETR